jgi:hypothetical protein
VVAEVLPNETLGEVFVWHAASVARAAPRTDQLVE